MNEGNHRGGSYSVGLIYCIVLYHQMHASAMHARSPTDTWTAPDTDGSACPQGACAGEYVRTHLAQQFLSLFFLRWKLNHSLFAICNRGAKHCNRASKSLLVSNSFITGLFLCCVRERLVLSRDVAIPSRKKKIIEVSRELTVRKRLISGPAGDKSLCGIWTELAHVSRAIATLPKSQPGLSLSKPQHGLPAMCGSNLCHVPPRGPSPGAATTNVT